MTGVSVVIPVLNGEPWLGEVITSVVAEAGGRPLEVLAVDDGSRDGSVRLLSALAARHPIRVLEGPRRGAAAAINVGVRAAAHAIVCQIDQDVVPQPGWLARLLDALDDPSVGAVQGRYVAAPDADPFGRVMSLDLAWRYAAIPGGETNHVCTGNTAYRTEALRRIGLFDEALGYGYDNDASYRLRAAGYRLLIQRSATAVHRWRDGLAGYWWQQYGYGYGRLALVAKHPRRMTGDRVSPASMMAHPIVMALAIGFVVGAGALAAAGGPWVRPMAVAAGLVAALMVERAVTGCRAAVRFRDATGLLFPVVHLLRDASWVAAMAAWGARRLLRTRSTPGDSMRPRRFIPRPRPRPGRPTRTIALIPVHNEAEALPAVVADLRRHCPELDVLVIDDGSTDATRTVLEGLGVRWLRLPERQGIGSAMRAGLTFAYRLGYDAAVRVDGDGQHAAEDVTRVLAPVLDGRADVVTGSRFASGTRGSAGVVRLIQRALGTCLSYLTGRPVTDPTSGFCAFGPRAVPLLADHHPSGYPEPELRLFVSRNALVVEEVPIEARPRLAGTSTLTPLRLAVAAGRIVLALVVVPLRASVREPGR